MRQTHAHISWFPLQKLYLHVNSLGAAWDEARTSSLRFEWKSERPLNAPQSCLHSISSFEATGCSLPQSHVFYSNRFIFDSLTTVIQTKKLPIHTVWSHIYRWGSTAGTPSPCPTSLSSTSSGHVTAPPDHRTGALMTWKKWFPIWSRRKKNSDLEPQWFVGSFTINWQQFG